MPTTGNKRVSQLVELTSAEVQPNDLFLIIDVTARESKRIKASELDIWIRGTGSVVVNAGTASYVLGSNVDGYVLNSYNANTALVALNANQANTATNATSASFADFAQTASFALNNSSNSSSFLIYSGVPNGTASYALIAANSVTSNVTSKLLYFGGDNGTASYAIKTGQVNNAVNADTASYLNNTTGASIATASYAFVAQVANSGFSNSSSYLISSPNNGTASYALKAKSFANIISCQGVFLANTQSATKSQLDTVDIFWSTSGSARTPIESMGTLKIPFTSSAPTTGTLYMAVLDRNTGMQTVLDSTSIDFKLSPTLGTWGNYDSGSIKQPFSLMGQASLYGSYMVFISASNNLEIDSTRTSRFNIQSESDNFSEYSNEPISFDVYPSNTATFTFTSTDGGPFTDNTVGLQYSMSLGKQIYTINASNQNFYSIKYFWLLQNVTASTFSNNTLLSYISGVPNSLTYLSCSNCLISSFYTFESSSLNFLNCSHNMLTSLPNFPNSMSYLDCSSNVLTSLNLPVTLSYLDCSHNNLSSLPISLPYGMISINGSFNTISNISSMPITVTTMSFTNNNLTSVILPISLSYLSINNNPIQLLPSLPLSMSYLSAYSCSFSTVAIDNITSNLVSNGMVSGTLDIRGNGTLSLTSLTNVTTLNNTFAWTTLYDI